MNFNFNDLIRISHLAGDEIMKIYNSSSFGVEIKNDNSPLTLADKISHYVITSELSKIYPSVPILSEEGKNIDYNDRKNWEYFWLVDPLDGTKEFIKKNGEFTVNISLIHKTIPIAGIIYVPATRTTYYGAIESGAYKIIDGNDAVKISVSKNLEPGIIAVKSRSHSSNAEDKFFAKYNVIDSISVGSSLKFCMVAEGKAHLYYRSGPTWEWDTAAGHAIVLSGGGKVSGIDQELIYNKASLLNSGFIVSAGI